MVLYCAVLPDKSPRGGQPQHFGLALQPPDIDRFTRIGEAPRSGHGGLSRRSALAGVGIAALALAGCSSGAPVAKPSAATVSSDPLGPLYTETIGLISAYDRSIAANPALATLAQPLREEHRRHAIALASLMGIAAPQISAGPGAPGRPMPPTTAPSPVAAASAGPDTAAARALLAGAETTAQANAVTACLSAPTSRAAVLASIAACRATHVAVLS
ncbi:MAG TPA: hypothetical protein VGF84_12265 [Micromonosporaceae bacterium]